MLDTATHIAHGPLEARVQWIADEEPYDSGDIPWEDVAPYVEAFGVFGCVVETRPPACPCCGRTSWEHATSLWGIVGDADYWREIERELMAEIA